MRTRASTYKAHIETHRECAYAYTHRQRTNAQKTDRRIFHMTSRTNGRQKCTWRKTIASGARAHIHAFAHTNTFYCISCIYVFRMFRDRSAACRRSGGAHFSSVHKCIWSLEWGGVTVACRPRARAATTKYYPHEHQVRQQNCKRIQRASTRYDVHRSMLLENRRVSLAAAKSSDKFTLSHTRR